MFPAQAWIVQDKSAYGGRDPTAYPIMLEWLRRDCR